MANNLTYPGSDISREYQKGAAPDVRVRPYEAVKFLGLDSSTTVLSGGGAETITVTAPTGKIYRGVGLLLNVSSPGGTTGYHRFQVTSESQGIGMLQGKSAYSDSIVFREGVWVTASSVARPPDTASPQLAVNSLIADDTNGINIMYVNNTDADQTNTRTIRLIVKEIQV